MIQKLHIFMYFRLNSDKAAGGPKTVKFTELKIL